jgi:hypothetical protein
MMAGVDSFELILNNYILKDLKDTVESLALVGIFYLGKLAVKSLRKFLMCGRIYLLPNLVSNEKWLDSLGNWACINGKK